MKKTLWVLAPAALVVALALAGCGGSGSSGVKAPTVGAARTFALAGFSPAEPVAPGRPQVVRFSIRQPDGSTLTSYRTGAGPHTGIHLITVRDDLGVIIHRHPPVGADGQVRQEMTFPTPGRYRVLVDVFPAISDAPQLRNFQLKTEVTVSGTPHPVALPPFRATQTVDGYRVTMERPPHLKAFEPAFLTVAVTDPQGRPPRFTPWYGALAHAIFFHARNLDYFHTHVCGAAATGCTSALGGASVRGRSDRPGKLSVGVLLPEAGVWRLFLQMQMNGRIVTAPFTLRAT